MALNALYLHSILAMVADRAAEAMLVTDADLEHPEGPVVQYMNKTGQDLYGLSRSQAFGVRIGRICKHDSIANLKKQIVESVAARDAVVNEIPVQEKSNELRWLEITVVPIYDETGTLQHFGRIARDITVRKRTEQQREATQRLLASIFSVIEQPLLVVDESGSCIMLNTALSRVFGWSVFDLVGQPVIKMLAKKHQDTLMQHLESPESVEHRRKLRLPVRCRDGSILTCDIAMTCILQPDGRRWGILGLVVDEGEAGAGQSPGLHQAVRGQMAPGESAIVVSGRVQLVGLAEIKERLGERWEKLSAKVHAIADRIIRRSLAPTDAFERVEDDGYVICFAELNEQEAQIKARAIGRDIQEWVTGEIPEAAELRVAAYAAAVEVSDNEARSADALIAALKRGLAEERERTEAVARERIKSGFTESPATFNQVLGGGERPVPIVLAHLPDEVAAAVDLLETLGEAHWRRECELLLMTECAKKLLSELGQPRNSILLCPVSYATLSHRRHAEQWLQLTRAVGTPAKQRVVLEICDLPRDIARSRLSDLGMTLSPLFKAVAFELPGTDPQFIAILPPTAGLVTIPRHRLGGDFRRTAARFVKPLTERGCRLIVKDVEPAEDTVALLQSGMTMITRAGAAPAPAPARSARAKVSA